MNDFNPGRLVKAREYRNKTQEEVSKLLGIQQSQYAKYETGHNEPKVGMLKRIAEALDVSADYLLALTDNPNEHITETSLNADEQAMLSAFRSSSAVKTIMKDLMAIIDARDKARSG